MVGLVACGPALPPPGPVTCGVYSAAEYGGGRIIISSPYLPHICSNKRYGLDWIAGGSVRACDPRYTRQLGDFWKNLPLDLFKVEMIFVGHQITGWAARRAASVCHHQ